MKGGVRTLFNKGTICTLDSKFIRNLSDGPAQLRNAGCAALLGRGMGWMELGRPCRHGRCRDKTGAVRRQRGGRLKYPITAFIVFLISDYFVQTGGDVQTKFASQEPKTAEAFTVKALTLFFVGGLADHSAGPANAFLGEA